MDIASIISVLDVCIRAFLSVSSKPAQFADTYSNDDYEVIGVALDRIYFRKEGVLGVLRALAETAPITAAHREQIFEFNMSAPEVKAALKAMMAVAADHQMVSLEDREKLETIAELKTGIRWSIAQTANHAINMDKPYDPAEIANLVTKIEELNAAIGAADKALRMHRKI